jgi:phosphoglycerol transferase MdoB-like AlkP superfamily enzyme
MFAVDVEFFEIFDSHLNLMAILYSTGGDSEVWEFIWQDYPVIRYCLFSLFITYVWTKGFSFFISKSSNLKFSKLVIGLSFVVSFVLIGTASRGGWQIRPIDWGHAIFSSDAMANNIAQNGLFLLSRSIVEFSSEENINSKIKYYTWEDAYQTTRNLLEQENIKFHDNTSLTRVYTDNEAPITPNIVLIVLESFTGELLHFLNKDAVNTTPFLESISKKGINFSRCIANGPRSAFGISSILCSWPTLPGYPLISQVETQHGIQTGVSLLKDIGYKTTFLYGGDADFDNMKGFALANGFDEVIERENFSSSSNGTVWGIWDHHAFEKATTILDNSNNDPVFLTLFTATNHQPWEIPIEYQDKIPSYSSSLWNSGQTHTTLKYVDLVLEQFITEAKNKDWFENTIFVFTADHGLNIQRNMMDHLKNGHIPFIVYAPGLNLLHQNIDKVVSQVDILPTIFDIINYPKPFSILGQSGLKGNNGFALRVINEHYQWYSQNGNVYDEIIGLSQSSYHVNNLQDNDYVPNKDEDEILKLQKDSRSYLQTAYFLFKNSQNNGLDLTN